MGRMPEGLRHFAKWFGLDASPQGPSLPVSEVRKQRVDALKNEKGTLKLRLELMPWTLGYEHKWSILFDCPNDLLE